MVDALESHGLTVWWDQELAGGENWRARIETALSEAKTVIAVWSEESVGHTGGFVRDEATRALGDGRLVPVRIDDVNSPLGFGEIQAIDLVRWKRGGNHSAIKALVEAIRAKLEDREPQVEAILRKGRLRRLAANIGMVAIAAALILAATDILSSQSSLCMVSTSVSDLCGSAGVGGRPDRDERTAWAALPPGDCQALRRFIEEHPDGSFRTTAADMITARQVLPQESWVPVERPLILYVPEAETAAQNEAAAREDAITNGTRRANRMCRSFASTGQFRLIGAELSAEEWLCRSEAGGVVCAVQGEAICALEQLETMETEYCGTGSVS